MSNQYTLLEDDGELSYTELVSAFSTNKTIIIQDSKSTHLSLNIKLYKPPYSSNNNQNIILFTSGSSGDPKGVVLSKEKILQSAALFCDFYHIDVSSRILCLAPASSMSGLRTRYFIPKVSGCHLVESKQVNKSIFELIKLLEEQQVTHIVAGPPFIRQLAMIINRLEQGVLKQLKYILCTGANIDTLVISLIWDKLNIKVLNYYGLTESYGFCIAMSPDDFDTTTSIGKAISGVELEIIEPDHNGIGLLRVHSSRIYRHYLGGENHGNSYLNTGDYASIDHQGNVYLHGRADNALKLSSTELIYPSQLENILAKTLKNPKIKIYSLDQGFGLWVESNLSLRVITSQLKANLANKYIPNEIKVTERLPLTSLGKLHKSI